MRRERADGMHLFDLGLTARAHEGLRFFKTRWGGVERALPWYYMLAPGESVTVGPLEITAVPVFHHGNRNHPLASAKIGEQAKTVGVG